MRPNIADHSVLVHSHPAGRSSDPHLRIKMRSPSNRTRVTNGKETLPGVDGRTTVARRYHDICAAIASDQGGADRLSEARLQLLRRFAAAAVIAEQMEARLANGEEIDIGQHAHLSSTLCRLAQRIGLKRVAKDITPTLHEYVATRTAEVSR